MEDNVRAFYEDYWRESVGWSPETVVEIPDVLRRLFLRVLKRDHVVLDLGCGSGGRYGELVSSLVAAHHGLDISEEAVAQARARGIRAQVHSIDTRLPFDDGVFDAAICLEAIEHLFAPHALLQKVRRVLKAEGHLIVSCPNFAHFSHRVRLLFGKFSAAGSPGTVDMPWCDPHIRFFTRHSLTALLTHCGFEVEEWGATGTGLLSEFPGLSGFLARLLGRQRLERISRPFEPLGSVYPDLLAGNFVVLARRRSDG